MWTSGKALMTAANALLLHTAALWGLLIAKALWTAAKHYGQQLKHYGLQLKHYGQQLKHYGLQVKHYGQQLRHYGRLRANIMDCS